MVQGRGADQRWGGAGGVRWRAGGRAEAGVSCKGLTWYCCRKGGKGVVWVGSLDGSVRLDSSLAGLSAVR